MVRNIEPEDIQKIQLFQKQALGDEVHFVLDESFTEYFMQSPGVTKDSIFVAEHNNQVVGFSVLSIVEEKKAKIAFALELQCSDSVSLSALIRAIIRFCSHKNVDAIIVPPPPLLSNSTRLEGWLRAETGVMMVKSISFSPLLELLLDDKPELLEGRTIILQVDGEEIIISPLIRKEQYHGALTNGETRISMSSITLARIIFNQLSPLSCLLRGRIKVNRISGTRHALKVLNAVRLKSAVYVSPADRT
jgi:hypothetical protein